MWNKCGMARTKETLKEAIDEISGLRKEFYKDVKVPGSSDQFNEELAKAGRVSDFLELGELFAKDALQREESCGGHFREEYQTPEGEAKRRKEFQYVSAWEYKGEPKDAELHKEELIYHNIEVKIYDRYSRLLKTYTGIVEGWNGLYNNRPLPSGDYWYVIYYNQTPQKRRRLMGNFTLYR